MALLALSTIVKKYLKPSEVGTKWGPHPSIWTISKGESDKLLLNRKGKHFYFAWDKSYNLDYDPFVK